MSLLDNSYALIATQGRAIGTIIPDVTVEEHHVDELIISDHPVEQGAVISDHAYKKPSEVDMKIGFSNSTAGTEGWVQQAYEEILALQQEREPFTVSTGKRQYQNMLVRAIAVTTDATSEFALNMIVSLREVIIVSTQQSGGSSNGVGAASYQADPASTQETQDAGTVQPSPVSGGFGTGFYDPGAAAGVNPIGNGSSLTFGGSGFAGVSSINESPTTFAPFGSGTGTSLN